MDMTGDIVPYFIGASQFITVLRLDGMAQDMPIHVFKSFFKSELMFMKQTHLHVY